MAARRAARAAPVGLEPLLREMATSMTNIIQKLNANQERVNTRDFRNQIYSNQEKVKAVYQHLCKCTSRKVKI